MTAVPDEGHLPDDLFEQAVWAAAMDVGPEEEQKLADALGAFTGSRDEAAVVRPLIDLLNDEARGTRDNGAVARLHTLLERFRAEHPASRQVAELPAELALVLDREGFDVSRREDLGRISAHLIDLFPAAMSVRQVRSQFYGLEGRACLAEQVPPEVEDHHLLTCAASFAHCDELSILGQTFHGAARTWCRDERDRLNNQYQRRRCTTANIDAGVSVHYASPKPDVLTAGDFAYAYELPGGLVELVTSTRARQRLAGHTPPPWVPVLDLLAAHVGPEPVAVREVLGMPPESITIVTKLEKICDAIERPTLPA